MSQLRYLLLGALALVAVVWAALPAVGTLATGEPEAPAIMVGSAELKTGTLGEIKVKALAIPEPGLGAWTVDVHYNPKAINVLSCEPANGSVCNAEFASDTVRVSGISVEGLAGYNYLAWLGIACKAAGVSALTVTIDTLVDATAGDPHPIDAAVIDGKVSCAHHEEPKPTDEPKPTEPKKHEGDANCDDSVDPEDALIVLQHNAELVGDLPCPDKADINHDEHVDPIDSTIILQKCAGLF